jgi:hypothetical protein
MLHLLLLIISYLAFIIFSSIILCIKKKKVVDSQTISNDGPPSKKCNTRGGLLADDPDLKSFKKGTKKDGKTMTIQSAITPNSKKPSSLEGTDLKSFEEKKNQKDHPKTAATQLERGGMSASTNQTGTSKEGINANSKIGKRKSFIKSG